MNYLDARSNASPTTSTRTVRVVERSDVTDRGNFSSTRTIRVVKERSDVSVTSV